MSNDSFKVIIAGGSIAGLTLAKMLETVGIDFLVLEAYPEIAPQVGASIGLCPNGLRVLDQIGCYEEIAKLVPQPIDAASICKSDGQLLVGYDGFQAHVSER